MEQVERYVYRVYKEKSFSAAAKKLYISQPALSAAVSRLEKELEFRIFDRTSIPVTLTPQGHIYIEHIEEKMESESNMRRKLESINDVNRGTVSIGGSLFASYFVIAQICGEFNKKYPQVNVNIDLEPSGVLVGKLENDEIDVLTTYTHFSRYIMEELMQERLVIAMHKALPEAEKLRPYALNWEEIATGNYSADREIEDLSIFKNIKFIKYVTKSDLSYRIRHMLGDYKTANYTVKNAKSGEIYYNLMCEGIGALVTTDTLISKMEQESANILFFVPKSKESYRTLYLARKNETENNPLIKNFCRTAKEVFAKK